MTLVRHRGPHRVAKRALVAGLGWALLAVGCTEGARSQAATPGEAAVEQAASDRQPEAPPTEPVRLRVEVLETQPHDPAAFTQGLVWHEGKLFESTGNYEQSELRRVDPQGGVVEKRISLPGNLFGEGLERIGSQLIQLTWKAGIVRRYDLETFELLDERGYNGDGWGLAYDGRRLIMSDGSATLTFRDPETFGVLDRLEVTVRGEPLKQINEMEYTLGALYANVWGSEQIVRIDLETGHVDAIIDASGLLTPLERQRVDVLNGIAHDPTSDSFWITGKYWPKMFRVRFVPVP